MTDRFLDAMHALSRDTVEGATNAIAILVEAQRTLIAADAPALVSAIAAVIAEQTRLRDAHLEIVMCYSEDTAVRKRPTPRPR